MSTFQQWLWEREACPEAREWVEALPPEEAWDICEEPDWLLWYANEVTPQVTVPEALDLLHRFSILIASRAEKAAGMRAETARRFASTSYLTVTIMERIYNSHRPAPISLREVMDHLHTVAHSFVKAMDDMNHPESGLIKRLMVNEINTTIRFPGVPEGVLEGEES